MSFPAAAAVAASALLRLGRSAARRLGRGPASAAAAGRPAAADGPCAAGRPGRRPPAPPGLRRRRRPRRLRPGLRLLVRLHLAQADGVVRRPGRPALHGGVEQHAARGPGSAAAAAAGRPGAGPSSPARRPAAAPAAPARPCSAGRAATGRRYRRRSSPEQPVVEERLVLLVRQVRLAPPSSKNAGSFLDRKKFSSWQACFEYSARFSSGFSFGQFEQERELGQLRVLRQRGVQGVDLRPGCRTPRTGWPPTSASTNGLPGGSTLTCFCWVKCPAGSSPSRSRRSTNFAGCSGRRRRCGPSCCSGSTATTWTQRVRPELACGRRGRRRPCPGRGSAAPPPASARKSRLAKSPPALAPTACRARGRRRRAGSPRSAPARPWRAKSSPACGELLAGLGRRGPPTGSAAAAAGRACCRGTSSCPGGRGRSGTRRRCSGPVRYTDSGRRRDRRRPAPRRAPCRGWRTPRTPAGSGWRRRGRGRTATRPSAGPSRASSSAVDGRDLHRLQPRQLQVPQPCRGRGPSPPGRR